MCLPAQQRQAGHRAARGGCAGSSRRPGPGARVLAVLELAVSRRHASVYWRVGGGCVIDIGSTNGTFINGIGIKAPAKLNAVALGPGGVR
jgi:hypothetical protein